MFMSKTVKIWYTGMQGVLKRHDIREEPMRFSLLTYIRDLEPHYMKESTIYDEVSSNIFDYFEEKIDSFRIGGAWKDTFVLKDHTTASYARIKDIDFSKMPRFCTHVVIGSEWQEIWYKDSPDFFASYYRNYIESEDPMQPCRMNQGIGQYKF